MAIDSSLPTRGIGHLDSTGAVVGLEADQLLAKHPHEWLLIVRADSSAVLTVLWVRRGRGVSQFPGTRKIARNLKQVNHGSRTRCGARCYAGTVPSCPWRSCSCDRALASQAGNPRALARRRRRSHLGARQVCAAPGRQCDQAQGTSTLAHRSKRSAMPHGCTEEVLLGGPRSGEPRKLYVCIHDSGTADLMPFRDPHRRPHAADHGGTGCTDGLDPQR